MDNNVSDLEGALRLRNLSKTRWTARSESICAVWMSYEQVKKSLETIKESENFDIKTKASARSLDSDMESVDFIISIMFMKSIMTKTKQLTEALQAQDLNIIDATMITKSTIKSLTCIQQRSDEMDALIEARICYTKKMGGDAHAQYEGKHRVRYQPARIDGQPLTAAKLDIYQFYRKEFHEVLNVLITKLGDNLVVCLHAVEPLAKILQPPLQQPNLEDIFEMVKLFPPTMEVDPYSFHAEFGNFVSYSELTSTKFSSLYDTAKFSSKLKSAFPLTNNAYRLLLTAPVTVAKDERSFSRLKLIKTYLRTTMNNNCLEALLLLSCEKDLTDSVNISKVAKLWVQLKSRRIVFQ